MRVKRGVKARRRRNGFLKQTSGFRGRSKNTIRQARQRLDKSLVYTYRDRRVKKRDFRSLWIARIGAAARANGMSYSTFMHGLTLAGSDMNRKSLAHLASEDAAGFQAVVAVAKNGLASAQQ